MEGDSTRPAVLVMCGMPTSGKTTTAARIHAAAGGALVRSCDVFADLGINVSEWVGRTHGFTRDVDSFQRLRVAAYTEMARRITAALEGGSHLVIVDAVHGARASRDGVYALAARFGATPVLVWCRCDDFEEVTRRFAARRGREHEAEHEASDLSVYKNISDHWQDPAGDRLPDGTPVPIVIFDTLRQRLTLPAEPAGTIALIRNIVDGGASKAPPSPPALGGVPAEPGHPSRPRKIG